MGRIPKLLSWHLKEEVDAHFQQTGSPIHTPESPALLKLGLYLTRSQISQKVTYLGVLLFHLPCPSHPHTLSSVVSSTKGRATTQGCEEHLLRTARPANKTSFYPGTTGATLKNLNFGLLSKTWNSLHSTRKDKAYSVNTARTSVLQTH